MNLGFSIPKLPPTSLMGNTDIPLRDRLLGIAMVLKGHPEAAMQIPMMSMQQSLYRDILGGGSGQGSSHTPTQAVQDSTDVQPASVNGAPLPQPDPGLGTLRIPRVGGDPAPVIPKINDAPVAVPDVSSPAASQPRGGFDLSDPQMVRKLNMLAIINPQAAQAIARLAMASRPDMVVGPDGRARNSHDPNAYQGRISNPTAVNNTIVDMTDPGNVNRVIPSPPVPGAVPVYDNLGHVVDWTLPSGAQQAITAAKAVEDRHNRADEAIGYLNAGTGARNANTSAGGLANTRTQNAYVPPPGFVVRQKGK